ncbi:MAG: SMC family ATPase [Actinomycetales bacterium]|nr:SMC family ATPase [Candidatus Phosphoribacter baldrii]
MRLHRLSVQAFGPFADRVEVDFDDLADAGIFLIHGATGSGKTSLLDAICFALYGRVPGLRPSGEALRSDHAPSDDVPEVELELTVSGRRLRVIRSPDHQRPKKRGTGLTPVRGQVRLEEWSPDRGWTTVATRADDVGDTLGQALGMGLDQFAKVVLLPQGDFAAFLRATAEDRRALLERLFDVRRYTGVEAWLAERRRVTAAAAVHAHAALAADLVRVDDVLGRVPPTSRRDCRAGQRPVRRGDSAKRSRVRRTLCAPTPWRPWRQATRPTTRHPPLSRPTRSPPSPSRRPDAAPPPRPC